MTRSVSSKLTAALAMLALFLFACTTTSETDPVAESTDPDSEFRTGDQGDVEVPVADTGGQAKLDLPTLYFDFDRSSIRKEERAMLRSSGDQLRSGRAPVRL